MDEAAFLEYVQSGGQVETGDWMPDDYRAKLIKFIEMHGNSELMGVLPEREWILRIQATEPDLVGLPPYLDELIRWTLMRNPRDRPSTQQLATICQGEV